MSSDCYINSNKNFILKYFRCKRTETGIGMEASVLPIPAFHHCEPLCVACTQCTVECRMGNTDTLHPNSCFCSFSIPTSRIKFLLLVYISNGHAYTQKRPTQYQSESSLTLHACADTFLYLTTSIISFTRR